MLVSQTEATCGVRLGVEVHEHGRLVTHDPRVVPCIQEDNRGCRALEGTAVSVDSLYPAPGQEPDVSVVARLPPGATCPMRGSTLNSLWLRVE